MVNVILIGILVLILGGAGYYIYNAKKNGKKCIGCPANGSCNGCHCGLADN